jgi:hypothetical protein
MIAVNGESGRPKGAFTISGVISVGLSAETITSIETERYPGDLISTVCSPGETEVSVRGVFPTITESRYTVAPTGFDEMTRVPAPGETVVCVIGGVDGGTVETAVSLVPGRAIGVVLAVPEDVTFAFVAETVRVFVRLCSREGLLIVTVYCPGGISTWNP